MAVIAILFAVLISQAQELDYKGHRIDASGKVMDKEGNHIGNVTKEGVITDAAGTIVAYVDGKGSLIDSKTHKNLGKVGKNRSLLINTKLDC